MFRVGVGAAMDAPAPYTPADTARADRRSQLHIIPERVVRQATRNNRARLLHEFDAWLRSEQLTTFDMLMALGLQDSETIIALILVRYGQHLFRSGAAYNRGDDQGSCRTEAWATPLLRSRMGPRFRLVV